MKHYSWVLPHTQAFDLYERLPGGTLFEEGDGGAWRVDYFCFTDGPPVPEDLLQMYPEFSCENIEAQDWLNEFQKALPPIEVGPFYIHTPAHPASTHHPVCLCIDAGMAFGSGHHETTQSCLFLISELFQKNPWGKALDLGCGSGILTLALNGLRPGSAVGSDHDAQAVAIAKENALINQIPCPFVVCEGIPESEGPFDLIVANLYSHILLELAPYMARASHLILSGMMNSQASQVQEAYSAHGWTYCQYREMGQWTSFGLVKSQQGSF